MKNTFYSYIILFCFSILFFACEKVEIPDVPEFDKTEILSFNAYDINKSDIIEGVPVIDTDNGNVTVQIKKGADLKQIFVILSISSGATVSPAMNGYEDWSAGSKIYTVTSPSGKHSQKWTITLTHLK